MFLYSQLLSLSVYTYVFTTSVTNARRITSYSVVRHSRGTAQHVQWFKEEDGQNTECPGECNETMPRPPWSRTGEPKRNTLGSYRFTIIHASCELT